MNSKSKKLVSFDMDGTLSYSRCKTDKEMTDLLAQLCQKYIVVIISGGSFESIVNQIISEFDVTKNLSNIYLYPNTGTRKYVYKDGGYVLEYKNDFSPDEIKKINSIFEKAITDLDLTPEVLYGPLIENRGAQITFAGQGQHADITIKEVWDPDQKKRKKIREYILPHLPDFSVNIAGTTSVDVTRKGVDKGSAMERITIEFGLSKSDVLFIGDSVFPGGNDYPVQEVGIDTIQVDGLEGAKKVIKKLIS